jgi:hypothetical protein
MITEQARCIIVLQLTDELLAQLRPFMEGLDITTTLHSEWAYQEVYEHGQFTGYAKVEQHRQRLTMRGDVYDALTARVNHSNRMAGLLSTKPHERVSCEDRRRDIDTRMDQQGAREGSSSEVPQRHALHYRTNYHCPVNTDKGGGRKAAAFLCFPASAGRPSPPALPNAADCSYA